MAGLNVVVAETDAQARYLFTSSQQAFINIRSGRPGKLPPPIDDIGPLLEGPAGAMLASVLSHAVVGSPGPATTSLT